MNTTTAIANMIRFRPRLWTVNLLSMLVLQVGWLVPGLLTREFFNLLSGSAPATLGIEAIIAGLAGCGVARVIGLIGLPLTNRPFGEIARTLLQRNVLARILQMPGARALPEEPGKAVNRFKDDAFEPALFALFLNDLIGSGLVTIINFALMLSINWRITLIAAVPMAFVLLISNLATTRVEKYREVFREASGKVAGFISETFGAAQAIKIAGAEERMVTHFRTLNDKRRDAGLIDRLFQELLESVFMNATAIGAGVMLLASASELRAGTFTLGDFALFVYSFDAFGEFTGFLGFLIARLKQAGVGLNRLQRLMQGAPPRDLIKHQPIYEKGELPTIPHPAKTAQDMLNTLSVRGLNYKHRSMEGVTAATGIHDINLELNRGELVVVTGRIGSGKTTLARVLLGLLPRDSGEILWNGTRVEDAGDFFTPPRCAYTAQVPRLFSLSLRENLLMGLPADKYDIPAALSAAVMDDDLPLLEKGLDTMVGPKGVRLSGGQVQRSAAARMFLREPELFVFDDLSSALDVETERKLWDRLDTRRGQQTGAVTCLVISHRHAIMQRADRIIVLKEGRIEAQGSVSELLRISPEFRDLWQSEPQGPAEVASVLEP